MVALKPNEVSSTGVLNCISGLGLVCMVVAVVGIKLKWFKHRLTFNSNNEDPEIASPSHGFYSTNGNGGEGGGGVHRNSSISSEPQIVRATFRSFDDGFDITPPAVLPPIRITNNRPPIRPRSRVAPPPQTVVNEDAVEKKSFQETNHTGMLDVGNDITSLHVKADSQANGPEFLDKEHTLMLAESSQPAELANINEENILRIKATPENIQQENSQNVIDGHIDPDELSINDLTNEGILSSPHVGSVSIDVLPSNKQKIIFTSTENIHSPLTYAIDAIDDRHVHLELPRSPIPPNSPPPRQSQLDNYNKSEKNIIQPDETDELPHAVPIHAVKLNVPPRNPPTYLPPPPPYSELDKTSPVSTPNSTKAKRQVRIITPQVSEQSDSDESEDTYSFEATRSRSTPDLTLPPPNAVRPYLQLSSSPSESTVSQSTPNLDATANPHKSNPFASFFSFLNRRQVAQDNTPETLPKKKTKTIRVLKERKEIKEPKVTMLLNPLVQQQPVETATKIHIFEIASATPKPVQRKKKQLKLEAKTISQSNDLHQSAGKPMTSSPLKSVHFAAATNEPPVPKQRTILNVNNQHMESNQTMSASSSNNCTTNGFEIFKGSDINVQQSKSAEKLENNESSEDDTWNLVAQHRRNHAQMVAKQATVPKKMDTIQPTNGVVDATVGRSLELFNRPKTLREMQREKRELAEKRHTGRGREQESDTEA